MAYELATGYCWPQSAEAGETVGVHVTSPGGRPVAIEVARIASGRTVVHRAEDVAADHHDTPSDAHATGCGWPAAHRITVDPGWESGYYEVTIDVAVEGKVRRSLAFFAVRPTVAGQRSILLALATNTWHAYNDFAGRNLYTGGTQVSMQRPMMPGYLHKPPGVGRRVTVVNAPDRQMAAHRGYVMLNHLSPWAGSAGWPDWEHPFLAWAEREGYGIDVVTNADLQEHPELLRRREGGPSLYLSVGHDEYWSAGMRDTVEAFITDGGHAAFFSGNTSLWQVRLEDPTPEGPAATMVGYKAQFKRDPVFDTDRQPELTSIWSDHLIGRPENHMTGVTFTRGGYHRIGKAVARGAGGYSIYRPEHWIFDGTGVGYGDLLGADGVAVGYECDGCAFEMRDGVPRPTGEDGTPESFEILGLAPTTHFTRDNAPRPPAPNEPSEIEFLAARVFGNREPESVERIAHGHAVLGSYTSRAGGTVVTSGSTDWAHGLAAHDEQIEQITRNVLDRLGA